MRTTVTLESDTEALLKEEVSRTGLSFKAVLNRAVRQALAPRNGEVTVEPLFREPFPSGLPSFNQLADQWDDDRTLNELSS